MKNTDGLSAGNFIGAANILFVEFGFPKKLVSDAGTNFISDKFKNICRELNIEEAVASSYHHQTNAQVEACIQFGKHTIKNALKIIMMLI